MPAILELSIQDLGRVSGGAAVKKPRGIAALSGDDLKWLKSILKKDAKLHPAPAK